MTRTYTTNPEDVILGRYAVRSSIGFGSYGTVVKAENVVTGNVVAVKLLHRDAQLHPDPQVEVRMYEKIAAGCGPSSGLFAAVLDSGSSLGFHCIVFELCQSTIFEVIQGYSGLLPLPARHIMEIAHQLIKGLGYLHSLGIVHGDVKPDNVALKIGDVTTIRWLDGNNGFNEKKVLVSTQICILDLGSAVVVPPRGAMPGRIGARPYRAPEVTLGLQWSFGIDTFAIGCVVAEMYLMGGLFDDCIEGDREHLAAMDKLLGPFPSDFANRLETAFAGTFSFNGRITVQYPSPGVALSAAHKESLRRLERLRPLSTYIYDPMLHNLLRGLMALDPTERLLLDAAAKHPYFDNLSKQPLQ
ncbi:kinase-like protein [Lenzites betulinus]|nr:kinase-like protein [Lenzites betulinus]